MVTKATKNGHRAVCNKCRRNVYVVAIGGDSVLLDAEIITAVEFDAETPVKIHVRRSHAETCVSR